MKKNLRRILLSLIVMMAIGKSIYATDTGAGTASLFSGYMKFIFIGAALILLVLILFLSYKLDKEEPMIHSNEGAVSKKKLNTANKSKNKSVKKKDDVYSGFSESEEDAVYENDLDQSDFDSEEVSSFEEEAEPTESIYQSIDDLDKEYDEVTSKNNYEDYDENNNYENSAEDEMYNNLEEEEIEYTEDDDESTNILQEIDDLDNEDNFETEEEDVNFDTKLLDDLDDYEDASVNVEEYDKVDNVSINLEEYDDVEDDEEEDDLNFDTSVLDDIEDYEEKPSAPKSLSNSNMMNQPRSNRFSQNTPNSTIGFRNKTVENTGSIGFRNRNENADNSSIGFKRKNKQEDDFDENDFLSQMEETMKNSGTTSKVKKNPQDMNRTFTTSKKKKTE